MDRLSNDLEELKISAFKKVDKLNKSLQAAKTPRNTDRIETKPKLKKDELHSFKENERTASVRQLLKEKEIERHRQLQAAIEKRTSKINQFSMKNTSNNWLERQKAFVLDRHSKEMEILHASNQMDYSKVNEQVRIQEELSERRKKHVEELKAQELKKKTLLQYVNQIRQIQVEFKKEVEAVSVLLNSSMFDGEHAKIKESTADYLKDYLKEFESIIQKCKEFDVTETEVAKAKVYASEVNLLLKQIISVQETLEKNKKEEARLKAQAAEEEKKRAALEAEKAKQAEIALKQTQTTCVSTSNLTLYNEALESLTNHSNSFKELLENTSLKQFRFDCKKAVNIPVNAISAVSTKHLQDKFDRLHNLLTGRSTQVSDQSFSACKHPQGIAFCMDLLAKKFVLQADLMISSNPESAFCYATIINSLWNEFPKFGELILANFYINCPYLVPYYLEQKEGESDEEFYKRSGYQYISGQIEKQDKFLKRMTGIMRLYSAILITKPRRNQNKIPHNISNGWRWLSSLLNLEPRVDITATMLHTFLETCGFEMEAKYGKQFKKLLRLIIEKFFPACKQKCTGGAGTRLELLLSEYSKAGKFSKPSGFSSEPFW